MTKLTKKLGKSSFVIAILSFVLVAVLAFGGTYAYFSASVAPVSGDITVGTLQLSLTNGVSTVTELTDITVAQPNQWILGTSAKDAGMVTYTLDLGNTNIDSYVRVKVTAILNAISYTDNDQGDSTVTAANFFDINTGAGWVLADDGYLYQGTAKDQPAGIVTAGQDATIKISIQINKLVGEDGSTYFMGRTGTYAITAEAIQATYVDGLTASSTVAQLATAWAGVVSTVG